MAFFRLSRRRVLVTEYVEGMGFEEVKELDDEERSRFGEIVFRFCFGSIYHLQHFNADAHPGNYILMDDGRVAFLDFGMTKRLDPEQIELEARAVDAASSAAISSSICSLSSCLVMPKSRNATLPSSSST